jgi:flagellar secretion chaperone FliS
MPTTASAPQPEARQKLARARYVKDTIETLTAPRLVTMLYDTLVSDLQEAEAGIAAGDKYNANKRLVRAQKIVVELRSSLKPEMWSGGPRLVALYDYWLREIVHANVRKDAARVAACRRQIEPIRDAWHQAANEVQSAAAS